MSIMLKKITVCIAALVLMLSLSSCGAANGYHGGVVKSESWPMTDYPEPEGAKVVSVEKNYNGTTVGVVWESKEAAKDYTSVLSDIFRNDNNGADPLVTETDTEYSYSSYKFTVSYSESEERLNYVHIY